MKPNFEAMTPDVRAGYRDVLEVVKNLMTDKKGNLRTSVDASEVRAAQLLKDTALDLALIESAETSTQKTEESQTKLEKSNKRYKKQLKDAKTQIKQLVLENALLKQAIVPDYMVDGRAVG